ncbi:MAG: ABC transporter ATP-binding protein [candidate division KSB1 bacterium]|nr:ABC transporter ATP-binding protein [candidate division KSB1 bacterium]
MAGKSVVQVEHLRKTYGPRVAVDDVSFEVYEGEIFGLVGPNGAGKTTTIECVEGMRRPDDGHLRVLGLDPRRDGYILRSRIGIQLQESALHPRIRVWEALDLFAAFYPRSVNWEALIDQLGLTSLRNCVFAKLSGGEKRRLSIALALVNDPELVFLDELTTGLDPQARRTAWDLVREIRNQGKTVFLTTHFMEEAERLCDRVAIIDRGRLVAIDTPENLVRTLGAEQRMIFHVGGPFQPEQLRQLPGVSRVELMGERVIVYGQTPEFVSAVVGALSQNGVPFRDLRTEQPTLEDVFLFLTGHEAQDQ